MNTSNSSAPRWVRVIAGFAIVFGLLTVIAGGRVLFTAAAQQQVGNVVSFVLWFNFVAGFAYIIAGSGLWRQRRWASWLSLSIAVATLLIFAGFGIQTGRGGSYAMRTVAAMSLRTVVWLVITRLAFRLFDRRDLTT